MTREQYRALQLISGRHTFTARAFARLMWPTSPSWRRRKHPGKGVVFAGGALLGRLCESGWVSKRKRSSRTIYNITIQGEAALQAARRYQGSQR